MHVSLCSNYKSNDIHDKDNINHNIQKIKRIELISNLSSRLQSPVHSEPEVWGAQLPAFPQNNSIQRETNFDFRRGLNS